MYYPPGFLVTESVAVSHSLVALKPFDLSRARQASKPSGQVASEGRDGLYDQTPNSTTSTHWSGEIWGRSVES